jgi:periplasmic divalent cation tolerance protein
MGGYLSVRSRFDHFPRFMYIAVMDSGSQPSPEDFIVAFVTVPNQDVATTLARALVAEKLVACVNILHGMRSIYAWQGEVCDDTELLCVLKTRRALFSAVEDRVLDLHPYQVPEIIALPLVLGHSPYLGWLLDETHPPTAPASGAKIE